MINEIFENPPGSGINETGWEYIELYARPDQSLDGYMLLVLKGGTDNDRDGIPDVEPEIDEVFDLSGCRTDGHGFFTLIGNRRDGQSPIGDRYFDPAPGFDPRTPESAANPRWIGARSFAATTRANERLNGLSESTPEPPYATRLDNHGSSTYALVFIPLDDPNRAHIQRGVHHDVDFNGQFDHTLMIEGKPRATPTIQLLDEVAWSNRGGKEYLFWDEHKLSETHGLNPDALSRVAYYPSNPQRGSRTKDNEQAHGQRAGFRLLSTSISDESFIAGVIDSERFPEHVVYFQGFDIDGWPQLLAPTDRKRVPYPRALDHDPQPDTDPFPDPVQRSRLGNVYLDDLQPKHFALTPGTFNDSEADGIRQFRLIPGDANFDGQLDELDLEIAQSMLGMSASERIEDLSSPGGQRFLWQGTILQQLMAIRSLNSIAPHNENHARDRSIGSTDIKALKQAIDAQPSVHSSPGD